MKIKCGKKVFSVESVADFNEVAEYAEKNPQKKATLTITTEEAAKGFIGVIKLVFPSLQVSRSVVAKTIKLKEVK